MHLVIEASNIRKGGGLTHLQEVLRSVNFETFGIKKLSIWAPSKTLDRITDSKEIVKHSHPWIEKGGVWSFAFRNLVLDSQLDSSVDLLWAPGGTYTGSFRPYVTMVRNFLPFDRKERSRYRFTFAWMRFLLLEKLQLRSFRNSTGLIHISKSCVEVINQLTNLRDVKQTLVHHGINPRFFREPRPQRDFSSFTQSDPANLLYVSTIDLYKHQDQLIKAVALLQQKIPIRVDLVGAAYPPALKKLNRIADAVDPDRKWIRWHGETNYGEVQRFYQDADLYTCLSSCETFGMILLEAMAGGLATVCSNRSALPEIHNGTCRTVDPENVDDIAAEIEKMLRNCDDRTAYASRAYARAHDFSWNKCGNETFSFLKDVFDSHSKEKLRRH
jgi:glycosyltransferase involved in cell wall biosynthesis